MLSDRNRGWSDVHPTTFQPEGRAVAVGVGSGVEAPPVAVGVAYGLTWYVVPAGADAAVKMSF